MPTTPAAPTIPPHSLPADVLSAVLAVSLTGVIVFRPFGSPDQPEALIDMAYVHLNPAAQRMLRLPECPAESFLTLYPHARETGILAFYLDTFRAGTPGRYDVNYHHDGLDSFFQLAAQASGELLVVSFTDTAEHQPDAVVAALQASQAREQATRAEVETQRAHLQEVLMQLPAQVATHRGPAHVFELVNPRYQQLFPGRVIQGRPVREALPELAGQQYFELFDQVYQTGSPFYAAEMEVRVDFDGTGKLELRYFDVFFQALRDGQGRIDGVLNFAYDVTPQVAARRQAERDYAQVQRLNEELRQLNEELESRVADRTAALAIHMEEARLAQAEAEHQQQLYEVFEQAPVSIAILRGPRYVFELANPLTSKLLNRPIGELLGKGLFEAVPEAAGLGFEQLLDGVQQTGIPYVAYESPSQIQRDGQVETMYWNFLYQPLRDHNGQITGIITVASDATDQVLARQRNEGLQAELLALREHQLRERETFYQIFEQTPAMIVLLRGPEHRIDFYNAAYQQLFPGRELRGRPVAEMAPETASQGFVALLDDVYNTGTTHFGTELPLVVEQPDGQPPKIHYFNFTYQRFEEDGQPAGISVFAYDVAEQVLARQERDTQRQRQQELFEQVPVAMGVFAGPNYVVEVCNPRLEALWGRAAAEVLHRPVFEAMPVFRDQGLLELLDTVRATGTPYVAHERLVQVLLHGHLTSLYLDFVYHPLRDARGNITAVAAVVIDVSEQVAARGHLAEANADLRAANVQLLRTNVDLDMFIYTASHDLKQPIANIEGLLNVLREELTAPAANQTAGLVPDLLDRMQQAVERFQLTITQLTDVSRLQQAQAQPTEVVDLAALVENVRRDLAPAMAAAKTRLTVDVAVRLTVVFAPKNLRSIIYNLLSNSVKYHDPARPSVVRLRAHATPTATVLEVKDNGLGLSPTQQGRLYGMFQRLHDHVEGSGIGLFMVKRIVENAGGTIVVQSGTGVGTTFTVTLPHPVA